ncbi:MAG: phospholipase D family protein, partial [Bacteroidales bacterium]|nr:phospholipase D family protein [Bacteroidales bacterium]
EVAEETLDIQYYIWRKDVTGILLLEALRAAAERGVRVRLLLDDNGTRGLDAELMALDRHPNIEVRLFNPFVVRKPRWLGFITDFPRANRRMHNKSFTADNMVTIVGGRNIGDEYFGAADGLLFADLDVLAVGPVVDEVSQDFDRYWASESAYPVADILPGLSERRIRRMVNRSSLVDRDPAASAYRQAIADSDFLQTLLVEGLDLEWASARMVSDDPAKGLGQAEPEGQLPSQLEEIIGIPEREVLLVSSYFVPTAAGTRAFAEIAGGGVDIRILTNSLDATDVAAVHAGYAKRRRDLLRSGIRLYEMRRMATDRERKKVVGPLGSSGSSLHAKTYSVDGERVYVGSFNFDPRSVNLNTELGFVIDSEALAKQIRDAFVDNIPQSAYEVRFDDRGRIQWLERHGDEEIIHRREPNTGLLKRAGIFLLSILPIEWLL